MNEHPTEVDIVFVGGGTTACVVAGRLAAANPELSILLVEQGPNNLGDQTVLTPAFFLGHLAPDSKRTLFWKGNKAQELNGREPIVATGGTLGGGSSINIMTYARGGASDFDDWDTPGWGSKDVIPLMKKYETYHLAPGLDTHGYDGPINISYSGYYSTVAQEYLDVCVKRGIPRFDDIMDFKTGFGCQKGQRQDAAHRFIHTQSDNKHLHILAQTLVTRVLFDGTKAVGVEVVGNKNQVADADQTPRTILARKLVVVSAGAIGSPIVLQRSGVGDAARLAQLGVQVVSDLPGLGASYEDHGLLMSIYHVADDTDTMDPFLGQEPGLMEGYMADYAQGRGLLTSNACDGLAKLRPTDEELKDMGTFGAIWKRYYEQATDKAVILQTIVNGFPGPRAFSPEKKRFITLTSFAGYPISRGHVYISSTDPYAPPDFETGFMKEQADVDAHVWGYKKAREAARRMPCFRGEYVLTHPKFPDGSAAACVSLDGPPSPDVEDLVYTTEDNAAIEQYVRQFGETTWHSLGTIPMKPKDKEGCVDSHLNVYGTTNLKVADLSIIPGNVGANTNATALMIGEKAALLIAEDLKLNCP